MSEKLNVFCLWVGHKYSFDYVKKLRNMLQEHLTVPYRFVCLTDKPNLHRDEDGIEFLQAYIGIADSWCKLSLFVPQLESVYQGYALYLDLDVVIVDNIDKIVTDAIEGDKPKEEVFNLDLVGKNKEKSSFTIIKDWWRPTFNSSMMIWKIGDYNRIYTRFKPTDMQRLKGDQDLITEMLEGDNKVKTFDPREIQSYKANHLQKEFKKFTKIVVFHGKPKPHECNGWVEQYWK